MMSSARLKRKTGEAATWLVKALIGLIFISPLIVGVLFSIQSDNELGMYPLTLISQNPTLENYIMVFKKVPLLTYLKNSFIMCSICILAQVTFSTLAAAFFNRFWTAYATPPPTGQRA